MQVNQNEGTDRERSDSCSSVESTSLFSTF